MVSPYLLQNIAEGANPVASAYQDMSKQLDAQHTADRQEQIQNVELQQKQQAIQDDHIAKVFDFAGNGYVDEARYYAQQHNLQVPEEVFQNGTLAKGLSLAGKLYGDDKVAAQKFTNGFMTAPTPDLESRINAGQQAAGVATNPEDRTLQRTKDLELWKQANMPDTKSHFLTTKTGVYSIGKDGTLTNALPEGDSGTGGGVAIPQLPDATTRKTAIEDQRIVFSNPDVISNLVRARELNRNTFDTGLVSATNKMGMSRATGIDQQALKNTAEYQNIIDRQVVTQMKSMFTRPTEYETKLVQKIEGSIQSSIPEREQIINEAINYLNQRDQQARDDLSSLNVKVREPTKNITGDQRQMPGGHMPSTVGASNTSVASPGGSVVDQSIANARTAIQNGANRDLVIQKLIQNGIDPGGL